MTESLSPGAVIGILGGGQLGRMLSVAASRLGFLTHVYEPLADPPAGHVADRVHTAAYTDRAALGAFGTAVDVITYEFENVPTEALDVLQAVAPILPNRDALRISQDRMTEKTFLSEIGLAVAPYMAVDDELSLRRAVDTIGTPAILKSRRFGYDGKGQAVLRTPTDGAAALAAMAGAPAVLEGFVDFGREVSVIVARSAIGDVVCFDPGENVHRDGILRTTTVPASLDQQTQVEAKAIARQIVEQLDYVGVLGVELFVTTGGLLVNEIAPRVHNSGHWTQNGCAIDQFEQHIRAIAGLPLGDGSRHSDVTMQNLIGDDMAELPAILADPRASVHLYGKAVQKPGRKMGHTNFIG